MKLEGILLLKKYGLPHLPFFVLKPQKVEEQIKFFMNEQNLSLILIRTIEKNNEMFAPSIVDANLDKNLPDIKRFLNKGYKVIISHPGNTLFNTHNINIVRLGSEITIEAVGPGFIAPDLNRNGYIHERLLVKLKPTFEIERQFLVSDENYQKDCFKKLKQKDEELVRAKKGYLLKFKHYPPLSQTEISYCLKCLSILDKISNDLGYSNYVVSMGFVNMDGKGEEPYFWDIYGIS
ncbi:MAG: hypothetical protein UU65_C0002G0212 [candidate division CPR2 bacterium GW2011_GWC1_41_48]|uniref:Uncharacterized protein n=1 Tax=candidate division CPR2 bacterium GW2011_GWC1_41_48 TaxID=1618344 RepID=A0A0G0W8V3_UNCC2|nr:MAG: hypothetical protein UT47_C0002G0092 [candidate division CPR2 bacterium GW2011_GWC2_39_35]KKR27975.1 MAG: hypothetical protein UT60_C0031G0026 [candidate division CPR2 bacterium GW2011_GWD2_39_7]KKR29576.1 MAG: hypothetical protein UT59_C0004G0002 [candidate division CPR2 bacterium GW2011_GWD1_39_7]KKS09434.1 MAG: hypothetical protein UU65_C0002G0212 [candidate division CPR2 bacterium GW2011_GWC1_41_48]